MKLAQHCAGLLLTGVLLTASTALGSPETPEAALREVQSALDNRNTGLFDERVDMDRIIGNAVDFFLKDAATPEGQAALPPVLSLLLSSVADSPSAKQSLRALLQREAGNFVRYGVSSGAFAGQKPKDPPSALFSGSMLAPLFGDASLGRKEIRDVRPAQPDGDGYRIAFKILDHGNGNSYPVVARLAPAALPGAEASNGPKTLANAQWRVVEILNMRALMDQIRQEAVE